MPQLAERIFIDNISQEIVIDGYKFPWAVEKNSMEIICRDDNLPALRLTLLANQGVTVLDTEEVDRNGAQEEQAEEGSSPT